MSVDNDYVDKVKRSLGSYRSLTEVCHEPWGCLPLETERTIDLLHQGSPLHLFVTSFFAKKRKYGSIESSLEERVESRELIHPGFLSALSSKLSARKRALSSIGRAPVLHSGGKRFESARVHS